MPENLALINIRKIIITSTYNVIHICFFSSEVESYSSEHDINLSGTFSLFVLQKVAKLKIKAGIALICQNCRAIAGMNATTFV